MQKSILTCSHPNTGNSRKVCSHLLNDKDTEYIKSFSGEGQVYDLLCPKCAESDSERLKGLRFVCDNCFREIEEEGYWDGIIGSPEILARKTNLFFDHQTIEVPLTSGQKMLAITPYNESIENIWFALDSSGSLLQIDFKNSIISPIDDLSGSVLDLQTNISLKVSPDGKYITVVNKFGSYGLVYSLESRRITMGLFRKSYHTDVTPFSIAFFSRNDQIFLVHATDWNRLDISDPETGDLLTDRFPTSYVREEERPPHYLDYFHGQLSVSPNQNWIIDDGWVWHPAGGISTWNLNRWLNDNPWESEDGETKKILCWREYFWSGPTCWIDSHTLAVWGYGNDDEWSIPAVRIFDVETGNEIRWFAGPNVEQESDKPWFQKPENALVFDSYLYAFSENHGAAIWDILSGEMLHQDKTFCPTHYHFGSKIFLTFQKEGSFLLSRLIEN